MKALIAEIDKLVSFCDSHPCETPTALYHAIYELQKSALAEQERIIKKLEALKLEQLDPEWKGAITTAYVPPIHPDREEGDALPTLRRAVHHRGPKAQPRGSGQARNPRGDEQPNLRGVVLQVQEGSGGSSCSLGGWTTGSTYRCRRKKSTGKSRT